MNYFMFSMIVCSTNFRSSFVFVVRELVSFVLGVLFCCFFFVRVLNKSFVWSCWK